MSPREASSVVSMISLKPAISVEDKLAAALPFRLGDLGEDGFLRIFLEMPIGRVGCSDWFNATRFCVYGRTLFNLALLTPRMDNPSEPASVPIVTGALIWSINYFSSIVMLS